MVAALRLCNLVLMVMAGDYLADNSFFLTAIDFFIILTLLQVRQKISDRIFYAATAVGWAVLLVLYLLHWIRFDGIQFDLKPWLIVLGVMFLRIIAERYNYQEIPTVSVKERMIPAAVTVLAFKKSKVRGLPTCMTEDLRARLTCEEVDSILRWKDSKQGKSTIIIVRKIPFAIFITIGTMIFLIMEVMALWHII